MKTVLTLAIAAVLVISQSACSDDDGGGVSGDGAVAVDGAVDGGGAGDLPVGGGDGPTGQDLVPTPLDYGAPNDLPPGSGPNSGAICSASVACPNADEVCTYFGSSTGMCLSPCAQKGDACRVAQEFAQISTCSIKGLDGKWYCGWYCVLGGTPFKCPNDTDYKCVASDKDGFSFCEPK
jgi:hypothetical protein